MRDRQCARKGARGTRPPCPRGGYAPGKASVTFSHNCFSKIKDFSRLNAVVMYSVKVVT